MRVYLGHILWTAFAAQSHAQLRSSTTRASSTTIQAITTSTATACAAVRSAVLRSSSSTVLVGAEVAYNCLLSVPFDQEAAAFTVSELRKLAQFQSTLAYLKSPPAGYANAPVDILDGLDNIARKIEDGEYTNEYTFEAEVSQLLGKAYDGHFTFFGMVYFGALRFRRDRSIGLVSASQDGGVPKVYVYQDVGQSGYEPSAVTQINDEEVVSFLQKEADMDSHHDPDARWNTLFFQPPRDTFGGFNSPKRYPGRETKITFANGTSITVQNGALVSQPNAWGSITDGASFYNVLVALNTQSQKRTEPVVPSSEYVPIEYITPKDLKVEKRELPQGYPTPFVEHSAEDPPIAGFFIDTPKVPGLAVLTIPTFQTNNVADTREFQSLFQQFLEECRNRGTKRIIVDVRTNPGGKLFLGYEAFKQFFPTTDPFGGSRYRAHAAADLYGTFLSNPSISALASLYPTSPFNYRKWLDENLKRFTSWGNMFGRNQFNGDNFTAVLRYNLSDPSFTLPTETGLGIAITGYGSRSAFKNVTFDKDSIAILSDGICASTCALFTEFMQQQAGVRTVAVGGRPNLGPMQSVGGTKGARVLTYDFFASLSVTLMRNFASSRSQLTQWQSILPVGFGIKVASSAINFQDNIRESQKNQGIPTQFVNDTAHCRVFYDPSMYLNTSALWSAVADAMWGGPNGSMDESRCSKGSSAGEQISANPSAPVGGRPSTSAASATSKAAAAAGVTVPTWSWTPVIISSVLLAGGLFGAGTVLI